jgi:hypothetical protein
MRRLLVTVAALLLSACGGSSSDGAQLDSALTGTWNGQTTVSFPGYAPFYYQSYLHIAVSGQNAVVTAICPDGSGSVTATGTGESASWHGSLSCPGVPLGSCPSVSATYTSATATLSNGTMSAQAVGTATGCGMTSNVTVSFTGTK